ncbi:PEP-CTERM sorting domain-containing protein [Stieleria sp. TO1_6]|uniref:PEP-CTERM sorting domain-containing protein n=1 Tax=Stieleria tagensis TaxID=2956795 RepID=UPI00209A6FD2|nr:PEP-CTERM sorting domain-containing protein [Stieleria tagensis]MCO8120653.1 PEP-CTERM sorting domain-containing protein [Stieleria tagensis]
MPSPLFSRLLATVAIGFLFTAPAARADFVLTIGSGTITADGNLTLDVMIENDDPSESLSYFELFLEITPVAATVGTTLQFAALQSEAFLMDTDYVFALTSDAIASGGSTVDFNGGNTLTLYDFDEDLNGVPIATSKLLASFDLSHSLGSATAADAAGNQFEVSVNTDDSVFLNEFLEETDWSTNTGSITVGAVAIPEPASVALLTILAGGACLRRRR